MLHIDSILRNKKNNRSNPANTLHDTPDLSVHERKQSIAMMRINHSGEVCAQALYQGQALVARSSSQYQALMQASQEEVDHLAWCQERLKELQGHTSLLNPVWYAGSFGIGVIAGLAGDEISLGFLAETEHQVTKHLEKHLNAMSNNDQKSRAILEQMRLDEMQHATAAEQAGAANLPTLVKMCMNTTSKIMTSLAALF